MAHGSSRVPAVPARSGSFHKLTIQEFCELGAPAQRGLKQALLADPRTSELLILQGLLAPDRSWVLALERWQAAFAAISASGSSSPPQLVQRFLHWFGVADDDLHGIPLAAHHSSLRAEPIAGQNRIGYMPMGNVDFAHGLMLGGLGTGGLERSLGGSFRRVGVTCTTENVEDLTGQNAASQCHIFLRSARRQFASVLGTDPAPRDKLSSFRWRLPSDHGSYHALYPEEWFVYFGPELPAVVRVHAFSPIFSDNYRETSFPVIVYVVSIQNREPVPLDASFLFTLQNLVGWLPAGKRPGSTPPEPVRIDRWTEHGIRPLFSPSPACDVRSAWDADSRGNHHRFLEQAERAALLLTGSAEGRMEARGSMALAADRAALRGAEQFELSHVAAFDASGDGHEIASFYERGSLSFAGPAPADGAHLAAALCVSAKAIPPGGTADIPLVLSYDFPFTVQGESAFPKRYTRFFGTSGDRALAIAHHALDQRRGWQERLVSQREELLARSDIPRWAAGAALNKLNLLQTTSLGWLDTKSGSDDEAECGLLLLAEANKRDYGCAETLDVASYGMARLLFWPRLEQAVLNRFAESVWQEDASDTYFHCADERPEIFQAVLREFDARLAAEADPARQRTLRQERGWFDAATRGPRKERFAVPHDLWSAASGPRYNTYTYQNANRWPDLPARAMVQAFRNFSLTGDLAGLRRHFAAFSRSMRWALERFDRDGDGLPDFLIGELAADPQIKVSLWTFDNLTWTYRDGPNACTAGLWLVATAAAERIAQRLKLDDEHEHWANERRRCSAAYHERLWDPELSRYRLGAGNTAVFADCYHLFYDRLLGLDCFDVERARSTLLAIYRDNVRPFGDGYCGAVNATELGVPCEGEQTIEMWTGVSQLLGLTLLAYQLPEGWDVLFGTEMLSTRRAGHFADWAEAYTLEPGVAGVAAYGMRAKNYLRCLALVNLFALSPSGRLDLRARWPK